MQPSFPDIYLKAKKRNIERASVKFKDNTKADSRRRQREKESKRGTKKR